MPSYSPVTENQNTTAALVSRRNPHWPIALASLSIGLWVWLAFLRGRGAAGLLFAAASMAITYACIYATSALIATSEDRISDTLQQEIAQCSIVFTLLLLFLPEYLGRITPNVVRSSLLGIDFVGLWATLSWACRRVGFHPDLANRHRRWPLFVSIALSAGLTFVAIRKFYVYGYVGQDLAYFGQIMHTTLHGHLFWGSLLQDLLYSHTVTTDFAGHNSPVMFLFLPFYALYSSPITLLVLRNLVMLACIYPAYRIARIYTVESAAWLFATGFLLLPAIFYQSVFDFYPLSFAALPILFTCLYYLERRFLPCFVSLLATLFVREDLALFAIGLGIAGLLQKRRAAWIAVPTIAGFAWAALSYLVVLPHALHGASFVTDACFSHLGSTPVTMLENVCKSPGTTLLPHGNVVYLKQLLTPLGILLPFGSAISLAALPFVAINLLAGAGPCITTVIYAQYSVVPTTVLFVAALLYVLKRGNITAFLPSIRLSRAYVTACIFIAFDLASLVFVTGKAQVDELRRKPWTDEAHRVAQLIPPAASVAAPRYMLPALANRDCLYQTQRLNQYHHPVYEYLILDTDWSHINAAPGYEAAYRGLLQDAPRKPRFRLVYKSEQFTVLQDPTEHAKSCYPRSREAAQ